MRAPSPDLSEYHRHLLEAVAEHGVHITYVAPQGPDGEPLNGPGYAYTVGLWHNYEQPEVIVFGLGPESVQALFDALADECDGGARFQAGEKHNGLLVDYAVRFVEVPAPQIAERCHGITWAYEGAAVPCVQLVWPDKNRRWPWDNGVRQGFRDLQPVLGDVPR